MIGSTTRRNNRRAQDPINSTGAWMITFSDLCTLLLTFFVLILSMSSLNKLAFRTSFRNFDSSIADRLFKEKDKAVTPRDFAIRDIVKSLEGVLNLNAMDVEEALEKTAVDQEYSLVAEAGRTLWIRKDKGSGSFSVIFGEKLLFESGSADLVQEARPVLEVLGKFLQSSTYRAHVDGHTDSTPVGHGRFSSNQELSLARAQAVLAHFITRCSVNPRRLAIGGYGSTHPLVDNTSPAGRAMNRRVEIVFDK